jgi:hypothetical protein
MCCSLWGDSAQVFTHGQCLRTNRHKNMPCFGGGLTFVFTDRKSCITKHELWNKNLKTYHPPKHVKFWQVAQHVFQCSSNPSPWNISHWNMSSFDKRPNTCFDARAAWALETYPIETCNVSGAMFRPHPPIFHVPPCDLHPCPMTHPWRFRPFFNFALSSCIFYQILTSSSMFPC